VQVRRDAEQLSENMIDNIITLWNRALSNPAVMTVVLDCEARLGNNTPFDSIYKMTVIVQKAQSPAAIRWVFQSIADLARAGILRGGVTLTMLGQGGSGGSNIGLVALLVFKMTLRDHLLTHQLELLDVSPHFKMELRKCFASHTTYREACGFPDAKYAEAPQADLAWQADFNKAETLLWTLCEAMIFGGEYDGCLKQAIRLRKPANEVFDYGVIGEAMTDIFTEIEKMKEVATLVSGDIVTGATAAHDDEDDLDGHDGAKQGTKQTQALLAKDEHENIKSKWQKFAGVTVRQHVKLLVEPKQASLMPALLADMKVMAVVPEKGFYTLFVYDTKTAGENKYRPHIRMPPLREDHLLKLMGGIVSARMEGTLGLRPSDMFAILDGGRDLSDKMVNNCFVDLNGKPLQKSKRTIHISYLEDALQDSRSLHRGFTTLNQIERMHLYTSTTLALKERKRIIYPGTNSGNFIGPLAAPEKTRRLQLDQVQKRELYGPMHRLSDKRGGLDDPDADVECDIADADDSVQQNVFFHTMTVSFWKEVLHSYCVKSVVHFTGVDGALARACIDAKARANVACPRFPIVAACPPSIVTTSHSSQKLTEKQVPYLGMCFSECHVNMMFDYLGKEVYIDMQREDSPLYQSSMVVQLEAKCQEDNEDEDEAPKPKAHAKAKAKVKGQANAKGKNKARTQAAGQKKPKKAKTGGEDDEDLAKALADLEGEDAEGPEEEEAEEDVEEE